jgi:hypothetical protein
MYSNADLGDFLKRLYHAIFDRRRNIPRVLESIAGKDVRKALEIFVAIITSGYLSTLAIASNTMGAGEVSLKAHTILRILMRTNRRFFSNDSGFVQNIFAYDTASEKPDNFLLTEVLFFLFNNRKTIGRINVEGYFTGRQVADALQKLGYVPDDVLLALGYSRAQRTDCHRQDEYERGPMGRFGSHPGRRMGPSTNSDGTL